MSKMTPAQVKTEGDLRNYIIEHVDGFRKAMAEKRVLDAAFLLRDWVSATICFSHKDMLLKHNDLGGVVGVFQASVAKKGGLWCGGTASFFRGILKLCGIKSLTHKYGHSQKHVTHDTNVIRTPRGNHYQLDAYLTYHYADVKSGKIVEFADLLYRIRKKDYKSLKRVDRHVERCLVLKKGEVPSLSSWLYIDSYPTAPERYDDRWVYDGAYPTFGGLLREGTPFRTRAETVGAKGRLREFMFDLMLMNCRIGKLKVDAPFPNSQSAWRKRLDRAFAMR